MRQMTNIIRKKSATQGLLSSACSPKVRVVFFIAGLLLVAPVSSASPFLLLILDKIIK